MGEVDYYELLGVGRNASASEIKSAYRTLVKVMHPDAGGTSGTFRLLREAYETLHDPVRRAAYDRSADTDDQGGDEDDSGDSSTTDRAPRAGEDAGRGAARDRWHRWDSGPRARASSRPRARRAREFGEDPDFTPPAPQINPVTIAWCAEVNPRERVRYLPTLAGSPAATATVAGVWLVLLVLSFGTLTLPAPLVAMWLLAVAGTSVALVVLARRHLVTAQVNRAFTEEFGGRPVFGQPGTERSQLAERLTADLLVKHLTWLPGARIFHSLAGPDSVFADIDHAVLCGRRLVLIESKLWLPGHYTADEAGALFRNGHPFRGGSTELPAAVDAYRELLPDVEVRGVLIVYPSRSGTITTGKPADARVPPMSAEHFVHEIGAWLAVQSSIVDRDVFRTVVGQVVS